MSTHKTIEIKFVSSDGTGLAKISTLNIPDKTGDIVLAGSIGQQVVPILPAHDWKSVPLGKARISETSNEALASLRFNLDVKAAREWWSALRFDQDQQWSFSFTPIKTTLGQHENKAVRFLHAIKVHEISPVVVSAGVNTATLDVKSLEQVEHQKFLTSIAKINSNPILLREFEAQSLLLQTAERTKLLAQGKVPCITSPPPPWLQKICDQLCQELSVLPPDLQLYRPALFSEKGDVVLELDAVGIYKWPNRIFIRSDLSRQEMVVTLGHELDHHRTTKLGLQPSEFQAEAFGQAISGRF